MSKEEKKKRENEQIKILNSIINKKTNFESLPPLKKALEYSSLIRQIEYNMKYFPKEDINQKYYKKYLEELEKLNETVAEIYFQEKKYDKAIEYDKKLIKQNEKYHRSFKRLYYSFWDLGDKETAVIYGSFLLYRCDKKTKDKYYKDIIPEIDKNLHQVAHEFQNKSMLSQIKLSRGMYIRAIIFIFCIIYLIMNYKDLNFFNR